MSVQLDPTIAALFAEFHREADRWTEAAFQAWLVRLTAALRLVYRTDKKIAPRVSPN